MRISLAIRPLASKVSGRTGADAQPDSHDPARRKGGNDVIVDRKRILKDRSRAGTSVAGSIATAVKRHDIPVRKDRMISSAWRPTSRSSAAIRVSYSPSSSADAMSWSSEPASVFST